MQLGDARRKTAPVAPIKQAGLAHLYLEPRSGWWSTKGRGRLEPAMSLPRTVADVIREHVTLEVECIDRLYFNVCQPHLQREREVYRVSRRPVTG
jgi:hypothetical protein